MITRYTYYHTRKKNDVMEGSGLFARLRVPSFSLLSSLALMFFFYHTLWSRYIIRRDVCYNRIEKVQFIYFITTYLRHYHIDPTSINYSRNNVYIDAAKKKRTLNSNLLGIIDLDAIDKGNLLVMIFNEGDFKRD